MIDSLFLNLKRFKKSGLYFFPVFLMTHLTLAQITINSISVSNNNPAPGSVVAVTVVYCSSQNNMTPYWLVALNSSSTAIQSCPTVNQVLLVDGATAPTGQSVVSSSQDDPSDPGPNQGYPGVAIPNTLPPCPYTQVFNVTIPSNLNGGTYNLDVSAGVNYVLCSSGVVATATTTVTLPYPPPNISLVEVADGSTANSGNLILFEIEYVYNNTGPVTITGTIPAGTALASATGSISPTGTLAGNTITWVLPATLPQQTGEVWFLTTVQNSVQNGTIITNSATATSPLGTTTSTQAQVNIGGGGFTLLKSESPASPSSGTTVTYALNYLISGESLQSDDTMDNNTVGTTNGSIMGFDGTGYTYTNTGTSGGFTVEPDPAGSGNNVIQACSAACNSAVTNGNYPTLLRKSPAVNLCSNFMEEGNLYIPASDTGGADATMVIADNLSAPNVNDAYMIGLSIDCGPGNFYIQKNSSATGVVSYPQTLCNNAIGTTIQAGVWYTVQVLVTYNAGVLNFQGKVWPEGTAEPGTPSINVNDTNPLPCTPINGGTYLMGWQADGSAPTDDYSGLKLYGPNPVVNPRLWDTLPTGETYVSSSPQAPTQKTGNYLEWDLGGSHPVTTYNLNGAITLSAVVSCGTFTNVGAITGDNGVSTVQSNPVTLTVNSGCITSTPTQTPTITSTPTQTPTPIPDIDTFYVAQNVYNATTDQPVSIFVQYTKFPGNYSLWIYNSAGEHIRTLDNEVLSKPISQSYTWDGKNKYGANCASGVYILYLVEPYSEKMKRLVLIR